MRHRSAFLLVMAVALLFGGSSPAAAQYEPRFTPAEMPAPNNWEIPLPGIPAAGPALATESRISSQTDQTPGNPWQYDDVYAAVNQSVTSNEPWDGGYGEMSQPPQELGIWESTRGRFGRSVHRLWNDAEVFYGPQNLIRVGIVVAVAAPLANSPADQSLRDWYQRQAGHGQSRSVDRFFTVGKTFGEFTYAIPAYLAMSITGYFLPEDHFLAPIGQFGGRSLRALAIGAPLVGLLQFGLGAQRPEGHDSHWHPFAGEHGASGHAFVGAVPFLTAASMTESYPLKALLVTGSLWTGWSRIHDDDHYFSQVLIGWSIAYLATQAVNTTEDSGWSIVPVVISNGVGLGVDLQY